MELLRSLTISDLEPFLADPAQLNTQPVALQLAVASYSQTPSPLLGVLVDSPYAPVAEAAQLHINWAGEISEDGQNAVEEVLKSRYLGQNDKLAVELLKIAPVPPCFLSEWVPNQHLIQALSNPYLPPRYYLKLLERLAEEPSIEPRLQVAESPEAPLAILESLVGDLELAIRLAVQYNPSCPPELVRLVQGQHEIASDCDTDAEQLANLAQSRWDWIRLAVAQNPSTPEETLRVLAEDKVFKIRLAVAKNSVTSAQVLAVLAASDREIQAVVAGHDNATEEILHRLFATQQGIIKSRSNLPVSILERIFNQGQVDNNSRYLFFKQPNTPTWILERFADVDIEDIRQQKAALRPHQPELVEIWTTEALDFLVDIAKHPQVSEEMLERLALYPNANVQFAVAHNIKAPEELKLQLLKDLVINSSDRIKVKIAENSSTPVTILVQLAGELFSSEAVVVALLGNPSIPGDLRDRLWEKYRKEPDRYHSNSKDASMRLALEFNSAVPELERREYLQQALSSGWRNIQEATAKHPDTPVEILEQIAQQGVGRLQQIVKNTKEIYYSLPCHEDSATLQPYAWDATIKGEFTPLNLIKSEGWIIETDPEVVFTNWLWIEENGLASSLIHLYNKDPQKILIDEPSKNKRYQQYSNLLNLLTEKIKNLQAFTFYFQL